MAKKPEDTPPRKIIKPDQEVPLVLSEAERKLILDDLIYAKQEHTEVIRATAAEKPVEFTLNSWEGLGDCIAIEANSTRDRRLKRSLDRLFAKINALQNRSPDRVPDRVPDLKIYRGEEDAP